MPCWIISNIGLAILDLLTLGFEYLMGYLSTELAILIIWALLSNEVYEHCTCYTLSCDYGASHTWINEHGACNIGVYVHWVCHTKLEVHGKWLLNLLWFLRVGPAVLDYMSTEIAKHLAPHFSHVWILMLLTYEESSTCTLSLVLCWCPPVSRFLRCRRELWRSPCCGWWPHAACSRPMLQCRRTAQRGCHLAADSLGPAWHTFL